MDEREGEFLISRQNCKGISQHKRSDEAASAPQPRTTAQDAAEGLEGTQLDSLTISLT